MEHELREALRALLDQIDVRMADGRPSGRMCMACENRAAYNHTRDGYCECKCHEARAALLRADAEATAAA